MEQEIKQTNNAAKFAFFYVLSLVALVFISFGVGITLFQMINKFIVDIINEYSGRYDPDSLKFAISALLIASPIYYITMREIHKNLYSGMLAKESEVRKWLTYFILLVTSVIMIGWFIAVVNNFLGGELTLKVGLKALVAILINAGIFSFYLYDIKREQVKETKNKIIRIYLYTSLVIVIGVFIAALFVVESPKETRNRKIDERTINNIWDVSNAIESYYQEFDILPNDFDELIDKENFLSQKDLENPLSGDRLEYKIVSETKYEICTDFLTSNLEQEDYDKYYYNTGNNNLHDSGYQCLERRVRNTDKDTPVEAVEKLID